MRDDGTNAAQPPADPAVEEAARAAELSRAAREAVRQPADPRIDRQLARMGLAPDPEPEAAPSAPPVRGEALEPVGAEAEPANAALERTRNILRLVTAVALVEAVAIVGLVVILLSR